MAIAVLPSRIEHTVLTVEPSRDLVDGRRVRLGMVGGGEASFMGAVHRTAVRLDNHYELVAGALSSMPDEAPRAAHAFGLARGYADYLTMAREEAARPDGIEAVSIVAPDNQHARVAEAFLQAGIHVICDRPMMATLAEAQRLKALAQRSGRLFAVTQSHAGQAMLRRARRLVREGALGDIRVAQVDYPRDACPDPTQAAYDAVHGGTGGGIDDNCILAFDLLHYVTGLGSTELCAPRGALAAGGGDDANTQVLLRLANGAHGMLCPSQQQTPDADSGLRLRVYGSRGTVEWVQEHPDRLCHAPFGEPVRTASDVATDVSSDGRRVTRRPGGAPEGFLETFATLYGDIAQAIRAARDGAPVPSDVDFPTLDDGIHALAFADAARRSAADGGCWVRL